MKKSILKFGLYSGLTATILFASSLLAGKNLDFAMQEVLGYFSIITSLLFIFFGIKHYRDQINQGSITLGKGLIIGILISLFASVAFGVIDVIYLEYINPDFNEQYLAYTLDNLEKTIPPEEFKIKKVDIETQMAAFSNPLAGGFIMFVTVFLIGFIISLIAALILKRTKS